MDENNKKMIEDIAWEVFKTELGITFKRELTSQEKSSIIDKSDYQYYIDKATQIFNKKMRGKENVDKYSIIDVPASGKPQWMGGAYSLIFVYSKYNGNFIIRGYSDEALKYLKKNYTHYFYNHTLWGGYSHRNIWGFWKKNVGIFNPPSPRERKRYNKPKKWQIREYTNSYDFSNEDHEKNKKNSLYFKRLPKRWIPEFDRF